MKKSPEELTNNTYRAKGTMEPENPVRSAAWTSLLCFLLLSGITVVNGTVEKDELQTSNNNPKMEGVQLQQLQALYNSLKTERDQLQAKFDNVTSERDQLKTSYDSLVIKKVQLQTSYNNLMTEKEQLQSSYNSLEIKRDQLLTSYNYLKTEKDQLEDKLKQVTDEKEKLEISFKAMKDQLDQLLQEKPQPQKRQLNPSSGDSQIVFSESQYHVAECFRVGDQVRVKASVSSPKHGWGDVSHKSVGVVTALNDERMVVDFPDHKSWVGTVSEMELIGADLGYFKVGDRVRVKSTVTTPKYKWGKASHKSVGVVTVVEGDTMLVDFPEHKTWKAEVSEMERAPNVDTGYFRVGDRVRVKSSVTTPKYKWGNVSHKSVGVVTEIDGDSLTVDFPEHKSWNGIASEMELAPIYSRYFRVGDRVRVKSSVTSPKYEWGDVSHKSVGVVIALDDERMLVDFPAHKTWKGLVSEMELAPIYSGYFRVGDRVRVKSSVTTPKYQWGRVSHKSVGVITALDEERMLVDFPEHKTWKGLVSEMELAPSADSGSFRIGDRVRVKASVSSPKHGWGDASHKSVGVVTGVDGGSLTVDFPEHKSWNGMTSEMELVPSDTGLCQFKLGDRVRVKSSVGSPKYGWGDVSRKDVGTVKALKLIVDFPEQSAWTAEPLEMEIAA